MDGNGSIEVNYSKKKLLQYKLIIKLSSLKSNYDMLIEVAKVIGGIVITTDKDVIWVMNKKQEIEKIIKIYDIYPPLTSRKICQLEFIKTCLTQNSIKSYLSNRNHKYDKQLTIIKSNFIMLSYFEVWLSGFIEAKGCFSIKKFNNHSFSIGQIYDLYLIEAIKEYFKINNKVKTMHNKLYILEVYNKEVLLKIITHCTNNPLLGEKSKSLETFNKKLFY